MSRRLSALVIGNAAYEAVDELKNPVNDAEDVGAKLETCGFSVIYSLDSEHAAMDRVLKFQLFGQRQLRKIGSSSTATWCCGRTSRCSSTGGRCDEHG
jgi:hypothetical protein